MRGALADALQARGKEALAQLRSLDSTALAERYRPTRSCMLERLGARKAPPPEMADRLVAGLLGAYQEYWLRSMLAEHPAAENEAWLLATVNDQVASARGKPAASLDALEPTLQSLARKHGYHVLLGVTSPLRELMLWKTETPTRYEVALPEGNQAVTVVFMDDFSSLGWAGFATCGRNHTGGWTKPDRLYAVRSAYDTASENFRVSYLAHEAQHFADNRQFPQVERQEELEYRAKLVELAVGKETVYDLLDNFAGNVSSDTTVPHSYANGRVTRDLSTRLTLTGQPPRWRDAGVDRINGAAAALLREETVKLERR